ncbi:hypothetical protein T11_11981 [Trichinella zimbabwensis]|uniref:Uncharacterized protein n=1 Tax=Trichinella zimbabwensis TaxID=268475 RepID=A0A0V1HVW9_9BILA|nr:hypothetical protein T11_11981 [Trichinella zimbabwensis]
MTQFPVMKMCQIGDGKLAYVIINSLQEEIVQLTPADRRPFPFILADCIVFRLVGLYGIASWRLHGSTNGA